MDRQVGSWSIKGNLVNNGRCPKCTLKIPCKHYEKAEDLPQVCGYEYQMEATTVFKDTEVIIQFTEDHIVII